MKTKNKDLVDCLIKQNQYSQKLEDALKAILLNTINRDFKEDVMYKNGVLGNIKMALGEEKYKSAVELYS